MQVTPFGRYLLLERLAVGGTAEVFKAKLIGVEGFEKTVAVKRILPHWSSNPNFIAMLIDEAKLMVRLNHERIVQVYELGKEGDSYYMAMEWIQGTDLRRLADQAANLKQPFTAEEAVYIILEVLKGLEAIHRQKDEKGLSLSIVHRDISPQNILISNEGVVKIADFGIAHAASRSYETATGVLKGKFTYMSPEQARGGILDARTDVFAAGIILYELLSGQRLFAGGSDLEVLERVRRFEVGPALKNLDLNRRLKSVLSKALEANTQNRTPNAHEFWKDLNRARTDLGLHGDAERLAERIRHSFGEKPSEEADPGLKGTLEMGMPPSFTGSSIVSRPLEMLEITRSLEEPEPEEAQKKSSRFLQWLPIGGALLILLALAFLYRGNGKPIGGNPPSFPVATETQPLSNSVAPSAASRPASGETLSLQPPAESLPQDEAKKGGGQGTAASEEKSAVKTPASPAKEAVGKGKLLVRAQPWGKISIAGIVSGSERPISRTLPYGYYQVSVAFRDLKGQWRPVSRTVKVGKASTVCNASFREDGKGSISCN